MIRAAVVSNGLYGIQRSYRSTDTVEFRAALTSDPAWPDFAGADWVVVPNGSDHVALWRARAAVRAVLDAGGALVCADGWFTDWVPGHRWLHDNSHPTRDVRYRIGVDRHGLLAGIDLDDFAIRQGIAGWWACGYIEAAPGADVLLEDTWGRPVLVLDERSTAGRMLLSASGPLAELYGGEGQGIARFWQRAVEYLAKTTPARREASLPAAHSSPQPRPLALPRPDEGAEPRIGLLFNGVWSHWAFATAAKYRSLYRLIYVHELTAEALRGLDALVVPFQSDHGALVARKQLLHEFLRRGKTIAVFGNSRPEWTGAVWENRPVDNAWWLRDASRPPITDTDRAHPLYAQLLPRHSGWHCHGAYTSLPEGAWVIQRNAAGEPITWQVTTEGGGTLFASTKDPIVEHGVQQIRHLDHYNDALTEWLCGVRPQGRFTIEPRWYGVSL